ncbi:hypothetical protein SAMD00023353_1400010 [Rosellinia necatrix]|uniref:Uncharacterized protein n=1 Tax=Rosellinia necatrix TaxID=77044 RepID=A0A1W2TCM6_ROSNE|nr:hypothetical protein SAMD00023353_1400010 [Rosellinia necatrix]
MAEKFSVKYHSEKCIPSVLVAGLTRLVYRKQKLPKIHQRESIKAPSNSHPERNSVGANSRWDALLISPKISSTDELIEQQHSSPQESIQIEASDTVSNRSSLSSIPARPGNQTAISPSFSISERLSKFRSNLINLATQRRSRANTARVEEVIAFIKSTPTLRVESTTSIRRKLTVQQYGELLKAVRHSDDAGLRAYFIDKLRFDYTRSKKRFEVRMQTAVHESMVYEISGEVRQWLAHLRGSPDPKISNAASSVKGRGTTGIRFHFAKGESDIKSPDASFTHKKCKSGCKYPTIVVEIGFSQSPNDLKEKAEAYIRRSKGKIRAVVGVNLYKLYQAEMKNERRMRKMYTRGELKEGEAYSYADDEENTTGEGSILVWRPKVKEGGEMEVTCVQNKKFRDKNGNATDSVPLRLQLQDFMCEEMKNSSEGNFIAPAMEIGAGNLCSWVHEGLVEYRTMRHDVVQSNMEERKLKAEQEKTENDREDEGGQISQAGDAEEEAEESGARAWMTRGLGSIFEGGRRISARVRR